MNCAVIESGRSYSHSVAAAANPSETANGKPSTDSPAKIINRHQLTAHPLHRRE